MNYWIIEASNLKTDSNKNVKFIKKITDKKFELSINSSEALRFETFNEAYNFLYINLTREDKIRRLDLTRQYLIIIKG